MCTVVTPKEPGITQFLAMTTDEILKLPVNDCPPSELYKGISHGANHPVTKQMLALKYFVHKLTCSSERAELFVMVVPKLRESLSELLQSSQLDEIVSLISSVTLTLCETIDATCDDPSDVLQSLAVGLLDLLLQLFKLTHERINCEHNDTTQLENIVASVNVIRSKLFGFLLSNEAKYFPEDFTHIDVAFINKFIFILCGMAEFASKAGEAKLSVDVWRCITTFCTRKLPKLIDRMASNDDQSDRFEFLLSAVKTGCSCIRYGLENICESSDDQTKKLHGKSMAFTTAIFQRLAAAYPHDKFKGHDVVLDTLLHLMRTIRTHPQSNEYLDQRLTLGLQNVLLSICKSDEFVECFHRASCDEFSNELLHIGLDITKKLMAVDKEFLHFFMKNEVVNIVCKLVNCLSIDPTTMFSHSQMYTETVELLSDVLIQTSTSVHPNIVPQLLAKNLLQCDNILLGYILIDLWSRWIRCLSDEQCFDLILFWSEINEQFTIVRRNHLPSVHVKVLLQNLYDNLSDSYKLKLSADKRAMTNVKLWTSLGLRTIESASFEITDLHMKIDELYKALLAERTDSALYKLIEHLQLLETRSETNASVPPDFLIALWNLNLNLQPSKYSPLIVSLIRISIAYQRGLSNLQHFQILRKLTAIGDAPNVTISVKLEILNYLRHVAVKHFTVEHQNDILTSIRQLFNKSFIDSDPMAKKAAFIVYARVATKAEHEEILLDQITDDENLKMDLLNFLKKNATLVKSRGGQMAFLQELGSLAIRHECAAPKLCSTDNDACLQENDSNGIRMKELIGRLQNVTKELVELNQKRKLTEEHCESIASVREELASLK